MPSILIPRPSLWKPPHGSLLELGHPLTRDLVAFWVAAEGGGITVQDAVQGRAASAMLFHGNPRWRDGLTGAGLVFDGASDWLSNVSTIPGLSSNTGLYSIVAWGRPASVSAGAHNLFCTGTAAGGYSVQLRRDANVWSLFHRNGAAANISAQSAAGVVVAERWHHVVGTYDGAAIRLYIGARLLATTATSTRSSASTNHGIGVDNSDAASIQFWDGSIDHVLVYNRAISQDEIQWLYEEPFAMFRGPEVSRRYWYFRTAIIASRRRQMPIG